MAPSGLRAVAVTFYLYVAYALQPSGPQHITVVTTASLPWMTGTAVNPLLRTVELARRGNNVTLVLPFISPTEVIENPAAETASTVVRGKSAQEELYRGLVFQTPAEQEAWIREWVSQSSSQDRPPANPRAPRGSWNLHWYPGRYASAIGSIILGGESQQPNRLARMLGDERARDASKGGNILAHLPPPSSFPRDLVVLEEPEHLNWYHSGGRWSDAGYSAVCGIVHTDYIQYSRSEDLLGGAAEAITWWAQSLAYRSHCDLLVSLSKAVGADSGAPPAISVVENVHGVRDTFIDIGRQELQQRQFRHRKRKEQGNQVMGVPLRRHRTKVYFLAKKLWTKGYAELLELVEHCNSRDDGVGTVALLPRTELHLYGSGPDEESINTAFEELRQRQLSERKGELALETVVHPAVDHIALGSDAEQCRQGTPDGEDSPSSSAPSTFVNPSRSEVLCTATAEALAMGKKVLIARDHSNEFFYQFKNCRTFGSNDEFMSELAKAIGDVERDDFLVDGMHENDVHFNEEEMDLRKLSWEAATDRLIDVIDKSLLTAHATGTRPTASQASRFAHQLNALCRVGIFGDVMSYDMYMVLQRQKADRERGHKRWAA